MAGNLTRSGMQVFYTTHSPNFLSAGYFDEIFVVRKTREKGTYLKYANPDDFIADLKIRTGIESNKENLLLHYRNAYENTGDTQKANEGFFAKKIILVEGQGESLLIPYFFNLIGFDYIKEGISLVRCGNKEEIDRFFRLYAEFGIPCFVIFDGDKDLIGTDKEVKNVENNKAILSLFGEESLDYPDNSVKDNYLGFEYKFEDNLGFKTSKKGLELFIETKDKISKNEIGVPDWTEKLKDKLNALSENGVVSILKK